MLIKARLKLGAGLRHVGVLAASLLNPSDRQRLGALASLLRTVTNAYDQGGLPALSAAIEPPAHIKLKPHELEQALAQVEALVAFTIASRFRTCLRRSALRYYVFRATGCSVALVIGARRVKQAAGLDGHAWVELDGAPFRENPQLIASMTAMYRCPAEAVRSA